MTVAHHLPALEYGLGIAKPPNRGREPKLQQPKEVQAGVAAHPLRFFEGVGELLLEQVVVAADHLLRKKLLAVLGLAPVLKVGTVLTQRVGPLSRRALGPSPNV